MIRKANHDPLREGSRRRILNRNPRIFIDDVEHLPYRFANGFRLRPARDGLRRRVDKLHPPFGVGGNHPIANAGESHAKALPLGV